MEKIRKLIVADTSRFDGLIVISQIFCALIDVLSGLLVHQHFYSHGDYSCGCILPVSEKCT